MPRTVEQIQFTPHMPKALRVAAYARVIIIYRFYSYNDCRFAKPKVFSSWPHQIRAHIAPMDGNVREKPRFSQKPLLRRWKIKNYRC